MEQFENAMSKANAEMIMRTRGLDGKWYAIAKRGTAEEWCASDSLAKAMVGAAKLVGIDLTKAPARKAAV